MSNPMPLLDLRLATTTDQPFLDQLYRSTREDLLLLGDTPAIEGLITLQQQVQDKGYRSQFPDARHLLLWQNGQPVARLVIDETLDRLHIVDLTVLATERSQGYGTILLRWAQAQASAAGIALELNVRRFNQGAQRLYLKLGFQRIGGDEVSDHMRWQG
ncbi:acetyltransferase [Pseudomonas sp. StFLB209]|uniref:GNAT family N-acetyltransferase n=1 Tax=Pseudomonas sp. StFLB209 TaxID=1028989 RepID=UPI0004F7D46E|nr:GNAT family N-acetyltransferase [Pseudomonas sp. StFLB209]BAP40745.1 acetyltransferase [Pseudomonas sp. StFLB209]